MINLLKIKETLHTPLYENLLKNIVRHIGNVTVEDMDSMLQVFGKEFRIGIKSFYKRYSVTLDQYFKMRDNALIIGNEDYDNIREVYLCADDYDYFITSEDEQKFAYTEEEREELRMKYCTEC
jgi:hypothetical protein